MKTFRVKVWTYNSKNQELSKTFRCMLSESMDGNKVLSMLNSLTHYRVNVSGGLGKHAKRKGILNFEQICVAVSEVKFTEVVECNTVEYTTEKKLAFRFYMPKDVALIVELSNREWCGYDYTFFDTHICHTKDNPVKFDAKKFEALFENHHLKLYVSVNNYYYIKGNVDIVRDSDNNDYYNVFIVKNVVKDIKVEYKTITL